MGYTNLKISPKTTLSTGGSTGVYQNVVQKGHIAKHYIYAMQLHKNANCVLRTKFTGTDPDSTTYFGPSMLKMFDSASGHSQTWEYANQPGQWFIGTKGVLADDGYEWATQIARVTVPPTSIKHYSNTDFPRLSSLSTAGSTTTQKYNIDLLRSEAAVSPDYKYFLVATITKPYLHDNDSKKYSDGYFSLYYLDDINSKLNNGTSYYPINSFTPVKDHEHFMIEDMTKPSIIGSFQGVDIDDNLNIYISSQKSPKTGSTSEPRYLYKIPWGATNKADWTTIDLNNDSRVDDVSNHSTEFESVQVIDENHLYLTVAYHGYNKKQSWETLNNRIYEISWDNL